MPRRKKYVPPKKKIREPKTVLTEAEYWALLRQGKPVPQGAVVKLGPVPEKTLSKLRIRFRSDGSMEIPYYGGEEGKLKRIRILHPKTVPEGIRLVFHQLKSVKSRIGQAEKIFDLVERLHWDLDSNWKRFNPAQRKAFTQYFHGLLGELAKNPLLLRDENKLHAVERFERARQLLKEGNAPAAEATMRGIKNNMGNWLRKLRFQASRLERRRSLVVDTKFQRETRIFEAVDSLIRIFNGLRAGVESKSRERIARELSGTAKTLYATGWKSFHQPAIILEKTVPLVERGQLKKARGYIRNANKKIIIAASSIASIYPDKLRQIRESTDSRFKQTVLTNQTVLFHDMMEFWWNPKDRAKKSLILESLSGLSLLAKSINRQETVKLLFKAKSELEKNNLQAFTELSARAAVSLKLGLEKELF